MKSKLVDALLGFVTQTHAVLRATQTWNKRLKEIIMSVRCEVLKVCYMQQSTRFENNSIKTQRKRDCEVVHISNQFTVILRFGGCQDADGTAPWSNSLRRVENAEQTQKLDQRRLD